MRPFYMGLQQLYLTYIDKMFGLLEYSHLSMNNKTSKLCQF